MNCDLKSLKYFFRYLFISDEKYIKYKFKKRFGYELDLENPKTINEKIQWLKINDRTNLHTICADKYKARDYVKAKIGEEYLIPLIFETTNAKDINENNLPNYPVIAKVNHSRGGFIIKNKNNADYENIQKKLSYELKNNFYYRTREWQYKNIKPRIVVEKLLLDENYDIPIDYKIWCMNNKIITIQVDTGVNEHIITFFDANWRKCNFSKNYPTANKIPKPNNFEKMKDIALKLSKDFKFVRVDLYTIKNKIYFGELTFHPESGFGAFKPAEADLELGMKLKLLN